VCSTTRKALNLAKTDGLGGSCIHTGDTLIYTLSYDNTTNAVAMTHVVLKDFIDDRSMRFLWASQGGLYYDSDQVVVWDLGTLQAGQAGSRQVAIRAVQERGGSNPRHGVPSKRCSGKRCVLYLVQERASQEIKDFVIGAEAPRRRAGTLQRRAQDSCA